MADSHDAAPPKVRNLNDFALQIAHAIKETRTSLQAEIAKANEVSDARHSRLLEIVDGLRDLALELQRENGRLRKRVRDLEDRAERKPV